MGNSLPGWGVYVIISAGEAHFTSISERHTWYWLVGMEAYGAVGDQYEKDEIQLGNTS